MTADLATIHRAELRCFKELNNGARVVRNLRTLQAECAALDAEVNEIYTREFLERIKVQNDALVKR